AVEMDEGAYGAGLIVEDLDGERSLHHSGAWLGFENEFVIVPESGVAAAVLCNYSDSDSEELIEEVVALALESE
ncbi:MAG TPA: serine hydrolase, partial [Acidimicrobiales bacterium]|nr:serine hydrolase [Acidimicrobiales bacterium]